MSGDSRAVLFRGREVLTAQSNALQTKKRYVGYAYESPSQKRPLFDAKGIETVRRDTCPAVAKILERSLRMLFETRDLSVLKRYLDKQFKRILHGKVNLQASVGLCQLLLQPQMGVCPGWAACSAQ